MNKIIIKELHIHGSTQDDVIRLFKRVELLLGKIMVTVNELAAKLNAVNEQLNKAKNEIVEQVTALQAALEGMELPQEALNALVKLEATAQALDDLNPDPAAEEPEEEANEANEGSQAGDVIDQSPAA